MSELKSSIIDCFRGYSRSYSHLREATYTCDEERSMILPIAYDEVMELPTFLMRTSLVSPGLHSKSNDALVVNLCTQNKASTYKSMDAKVRNLISLSFSNYKLTSLEEDGTNGRRYYMTQGAIFDEKFNPVMMMLWQIRLDTVGTSMMLRAIRPILRISPDVMRKSDKVQRFILNRVLPATLEIRNLYIDNLIPEISNYREDRDKSFSIKVEIDQPSFPLKRIEYPSVSTTNEKLLDIALDHIDEMVQ